MKFPSKSYKILCGSPSSPDFFKSTSIYLLESFCKMLFEVSALLHIMQEFGYRQPWFFHVFYIIIHL